MVFECRPRDCTFPTCMCPIYNRHKSHVMDRHSAVATATIILSGDLRIVVRFPGRVRHLFQNVWGPPIVIFNGYRRMSPAVKWPACETTTHIHVVSNLRINGSITPLPHVPVEGGSVWPLTAWPWKTGIIGCPETSTTNLHCMKSQNNEGLNRDIRQVTSKDAVVT